MPFKIQPGAPTSSIYIAYTGNVGLETESPQQELHIYRNAKETILLAETNTGAGSGFQFIHGTSGGNWKAKITNDGDFKIRNQADGVDVMYFAKAGNNVRVGINKNTPSYELDVDGTIRGNNVSPSDARLKEDIQTIENALEKVSGLRGVSYRWIDKSDGKGSQIGVIAQEVEKVVPEVVYEDKKGMKSVAYGKLVGVLIEANKELKAENDAVKKDNVALRAEKDVEIAALKAENKQLRKNQQEMVQKQQLDVDKLTAENNQLKRTLASLTDRQETIEGMLLALSTNRPDDKLVMQLRQD